MKDMLVLSKVFEECSRRGVTPLYVTRFGSKLYGTNTPSSDDDYKVVYLPSKESMLLNDWERSFHFNTNTDNTRNTSEDIDMEFKSLHYFLAEVKRGDTGALDVAYSFTNDFAVIYKDPRMDEFFDNVNKFYDVRNMRSYLGYAQGQALKYSVKGERLFVLEKAVKWLEEHPEYTGKKTSTFVDDFLKECSYETFCCLSKDGKYVHLLGADYMLTNDYDYFLKSLRTKRDKYGERARKVMEAFESGSDSADWKALSHAYRCLLQAEELVMTGSLKFPLKCADLVKEVKAGKWKFEDVTKAIDEYLGVVNELLTNPELKSNFDEEFVRQFVLNLYK